MELESFPPIGKIPPGFEYCLVRFREGVQYWRHISFEEARALKFLLESFKLTL